MKLEKFQAMASKQATKRDKKRKQYNCLQVKMINGYIRNMEDSLYGLMPVHLIDICMDYYEPIYFMSINEDAISIGLNVKVTYYQQRLEYYWKECELGNIGEKYLKQYMNKIGKITQIDADDETIEVRWGNFLTAWIPIKACCLANENDEPSIFADFASIGRVM